MPETVHSRQKDNFSPRQGVREELEYQDDARDLVSEVKRIEGEEVVETSKTNTTTSKQKRKSQRRQTRSVSCIKLRHVAFFW